jgi:hypothetical protein
MLLALAFFGQASLMPPGWRASDCDKKGDEITVCAPLEPKRSPYRLPLTSLPPVGERGTESVSAERNRLLGPDAATIGSCSTMGPGGWTGCRHQHFKANVAQAAGAHDPRGRIFLQPPKPEKP